VSKNLPPERGASEQTFSIAHSTMASGTLNGCGGKSHV
jgi:hypothetical protein